MAVRYLLDTNIASYVIKGSHATVWRRLARVPPSQIGISAVTEAELHYGLAPRPDASRLEKLVREFLLRVEVLPWNSEAARCYGRVRAALEVEGKPMGNLDLMIASQALAAEAVLVSNNRAFSRIPDLRLENWTK